MERKLPSKESIRDAVLPYGPKEVESRLVDLLGERRMELHGAAMKIVNAEKKDLTVFYPSSGPDVVHALAATSATTLHLADRDQHTHGIIKRIKDIGGRIQKLSYSGNKSEIDFEWDGKNRKVVFHHIEIDKGTVSKLLAEVGQYDIYFEKKSQGLSSDSEITEKFVGNLKTGGHAILDYEAERHIGLEKEQLDTKYEGENYQYGDGCMRIYRKRRSVTGAVRIMRFNEAFSDAVHRRNGEDDGVGDTALEYFKKRYENDLVKLKTLYDAIPEGEKANIRAEIITELHNKEIDKSMVLNSAQNIQTQIEFLRGKRALTTPEAYEMFMERKAQEPTEQQLEKFREEGNKIFKKVFKDWV
ncbi:MAG: hypothetical protein NT130_01810 [Candidatus Micrarchaeota archaeon]|nr:hypothetical protein [Candidatus Micrarchaeota archaeon]